MLNQESIDAAMSSMGPRELLIIENEVRLIQNNVRGWLLRKNYTNLRDAAKTLQVYSFFSILLLVVLLLLLLLLFNHPNNLSVDSYKIGVD